jgi:hypothetical protein
VRGALTDTGHSAAFFATALQADEVYALERLARRRDGARGDRARARAFPRRRLPRSSKAIRSSDNRCGISRDGASIAEVLPDATRAARADETPRAPVAGA